MRRRHLFAVLPALLLQSIGEGPARAQPAAAAITPVTWEAAEGVDLAAFNNDLVPGKPTIDVAVYLPSNFDPAFDKVTLERMLSGITIAKGIYGRAGIQLNLLWVKTGAIDPRFLSIQANEIPRVPDTEYLNSYEASKRHPTQITEMARNAFESIVEPHPDNARTIYLVALQDVIFPFLEVSEGRNWTVKMVRTGGALLPQLLLPEHHS